MTIDANTICLDSDDEDVAEEPQVPKDSEPVKFKTTAANSQAPPVVPVSLTSASTGVRLKLGVPVESLEHTSRPGSSKQNTTAIPKQNVQRNDINKSHKSDPPRTQTNVNIELPQSWPAQEAPKAPVPKDFARTAKMCKPGDIIRISKTGQVEVLNKIEAVPDNILRNTLTHAGTSKKSNATFTKVSASTNASSTILSGTDSTSSRSSSPDDPLSILKDVVHIPADRYSGKKNTSKQPKEQTKAAPTPGPSKPPVVITSKPARTSADAGNSYTHKNSTIDHKKTASVCNTTGPETQSINAPVNNPNSLLNKLNQTIMSGKKTGVVMDSVDLTDMPMPPSLPMQSKPAKNHSSKSNRKIETMKSVAGTSKNIVVTGSSKNIILTPSNT